MAVVQQRDVPIYGQWIGTLDGFVNAVIRAQVTGYLISQDYNEGDYVKKDALLFRIDPRPFQAVLDQAMATLDKDTALWKHAVVEAKLQAKLFAQQAATQDEYDAAQSAAEALAAQLGIDKAAIATAKLNLGYCMITSPIDGVTGLVNAQVGDLVGPSGPVSGPVLTTVSTLDPIKAIYTMSEQDYLSCRKLPSQAACSTSQPFQMGLEMTLANGDVYPQQGMLYALQREVDIRTGSIQVVATFPNPGNTLRPGQFARIRGQIGTQQGVMLVPQRAVTQTQSSYQMAVVGPDNRVRIVAVEVGERTDAQWAILKGLSPGQRVVAEGVQKVHDGELVRPVAFAAETATATAASLPAAPAPVASGRSPTE